MKKFEFKLQKVLDYRRTLEEWAKDAYLDCRVRRLECESDLAQVQARRKAMLESEAPTTVSAMLDLERFLQRLDDEEHENEAILAILIDEEAQALSAWQEKRQESEALQKLRDQSWADWQQAAAREEQAALDEWSVMRRLP